MNGRHHEDVTVSIQNRSRTKGSINETTDTTNSIFEKPQINKATKRCSSTPFPTTCVSIINAVIYIIKSCITSTRVWYLGRRYIHKLNGKIKFPSLVLLSILLIQNNFVFFQSMNATTFTWSSVAYADICRLLLTICVIYQVMKKEEKQLDKKLHFAFVKECKHRGQHYYCTPPYSSFGGLRSFLFSHPYDINDQDDSNIGRIVGLNHDFTDTNNTSSSSLSLQTVVEEAQKRHSLRVTSQQQQNSTTTSVGGGAQSGDWSTTIEKSGLFQTLYFLSHHQHNYQDLGNSSCHNMVRENTEINSIASASSKEAGDIISFLAFEGMTGGGSDTNNETFLQPFSQSKELQKTPTSPPASPKPNSSSVLEPATLIYHESARSIVFRDHIRRSHLDTQKREDPHAVNTVSKEYSSDASSTGKRSSRKKSSSKKNTLKKKLSSKASSSIASHDEESIQSNESGSKKSKNSRRSKPFSRRRRNRKEPSSLADSQHSVSSIDESTHNDDSILGSATDGGGGNYNENQTTKKPQIIIANFTPAIDPLPALELGPYNEFADLLQSNPFWWDENEGPEEAKINDEVWDTMSDKEREAVTMLLNQKCVVKTVKKADWTDFLNKFVVKDGISRRYLHPAELKTSSKEERRKKYSLKHPDMPFNSFMTSVSLLPNAGMKMRCYGSKKEYCLGVMFALPNEFPNDEDDEDLAAERTHTWAWPSGYAAKTEFNISPYGDLINGREEALVSLSSLRSRNHTYLYEQDYGTFLVMDLISIVMHIFLRTLYELTVFSEILGKMVKGGLKSLPYNEIFMRVGGMDRDEDNGASPRSFDEGIGVPIAFFVRSAAYGDLIALMRTKKRMSNILGKEQTSNIPLLYITPEEGVRVITEEMQAKLLRTMTNTLNPFQNPSLQHKTQIDNTSETHLQQKLEELFDLDEDNIRSVLTSEECVRLAGGFGATDDSLAHLLNDAMIEDFENETEKNKSHHNLQNLVNEGLTAAVRSGDFNTSRQLLILYTLVASRGHQERERANSVALEAPKGQDQNEITDAPPSPISEHKRRLLKKFSKRSSSVMSDMSSPKSAEVVSSQTETAMNNAVALLPPPPPPLDTDRLRSATNSDGLLAVLGAAEVLKSMQNEAAKTRVIEAIQAVEEWIDKSENSVAYRLAHWRDLTAAQGDLKIATESSSHFMAFVSNKAIHNRKQFAEKLRESVAKTNFESISFLKSIHDLVSTMHSPCLRLELLQFILGLDNRYSVAHVARSVELAATCLNISAYEAIFANNDDVGEGFITNDQ